MSATRLIILRHGETTWNREGRFQGHLDSPLTPAGLEQAQALLIEPLTERELAVVRLLGQRLSYAEIAAELTVAQSTVKTHVNHIYGKFGVSGRKEAILTADRLGLIGADVT